MSAPVLKYPGAKWSLADWIVGHLPAHEVYLEPFFGSGAVFFTKAPSRMETINDLDGRLVNFFRVLRDEPAALVRAVEFTPWSRAEYELSYEVSPDPVEDARRFAVRCWQAFGSSTGTRVGWRNDVQGKLGRSTCHTWADLPDRIVAVTQRIRGVQIENRPALEVIARHAYANVLIYADPPYVTATRRDRLYAHEMTDADHRALIAALVTHPGPVLLSGYRCELYDELLAGWHSIDRTMLAEKGQTRVECLWLNGVAISQARQIGLPLGLEQSA